MVCSHDFTCVHQHRDWSSLTRLFARINQGAGHVVFWKKWKLRISQRTRTWDLASKHRFFFHQDWNNKNLAIYVSMSPIKHLDIKYYVTVKHWRSPIEWDQPVELWRNWPTHIYSEICVYIIYNVLAGTYTSNSSMILGVMFPNWKYIRTSEDLMEHHRIDVQKKFIRSIQNFVKIDETKHILNITTLSPPYEMSFLPRNAQDENPILPWTGYELSRNTDHSMIRKSRYTASLT